MWFDPYFDLKPNKEWFGFSYLGFSLFSSAPLLKRMFYGKITQKKKKKEEKWRRESWLVCLSLLHHFHKCNITSPQVPEPTENSRWADFFYKKMRHNSLENGITTWNSNRTHSNLEHEFFFFLSNFVSFEFRVLGESIRFSVLYFYLPFPHMQGTCFLVKTDGLGSWICFED